MNCKVSKTKILALAVVLFAISAAPSLAVTYNLRAEASTITVAGSTVQVWGFAQDAGPVTVPGPRLVVPAGDTTLTVNLINNLSEPVSIVIAGQPSTPMPTWVDPSTGTVVAVGARPAGDTTSRIRSLTAEVGPGGSGSYTWTDLRPGTYLYQSGTNVAKQVHMGLYGAVTHDYAVGEAYPGVLYDSEVLLVYSEIDPAMNAAAGFAHPRDYDPRYFLVNGMTFDGTLTPAGNVSQRVLLRFVNAGLRTYVPQLQRGYLSVVAEDGSLYQYSDPLTGTSAASPRSQYSVPLAAGKTSDAIWVPDQAGVQNLVERRLYLSDNGAAGGGMLVKLSVGAAALAAANDAYPIVSGSWLEDSGPFSVVAADGVLANDDPGTTAVLLSSTSAGALTLNADGSFDYTPDADFNGTDLFTYQASDGVNLSNPATVQLSVAPVNDTPVATMDSYAADTGVELVVAAPGVLANDTDVDGDTLTASLVSGPSGGSLALNPDGSFSFQAAVAGTYTFDYAASDPSLASSSATVSISVADAANQAPVATDDAAVTQKNVLITFGITGNDTDMDGTVMPATVVVGGEALVNGQWTATTSQGGTVINHKNGTVTFAPKKNFRGTDSFTYTVQDNDGATSNVATVRVSVIK